MAVIRDREPRTLLEALVQQRRWSQSDFCRQYARTAIEELRQAQTVTTQTVGRWLAGHVKGLPYPAQQRVLEAMFGIDADKLFGPPEGPAASPSGSERAHDPQQELDEAAAESARFLMRSEQSNVGPHTLEQLASEVRHIIGIYPNRPVRPLFGQLRELRNRAFELLEGRQQPEQTRQLYLITGIACGVLANASFDLGNLRAAETQARTAFLCAELAGHNSLRCWVRGTQALVAYWDDRPGAAVEFAVDGSRYRPEGGTALVRLASIEARARGRLGDRAGVEGALRRADEAHAAVMSEDDPGGMMAFPGEKRDFYAATARLWLGGAEDVALAERDAERAVAAYASARPEDRRLGEMNLARLDLAAARLPTALEGAAEQVQAVLAVTARRPTDSVARRLRQVAAALDQPRFRHSPLAGAIRHEIAVRVDRAPVPALRDPGEPR